jgi:FkbM family methyltransferase
MSVSNLRVSGRNVLRECRDVVYRVRQYARVLPWRDACRLVFPRRGVSPIRLYCNTVRSFFYLRPGSADLDVFESVLLGLDYEPPVILSPKFIVDAGAHIGLATLYFHNRYPDAAICAIEPERSNFELLQRNCGGLPRVHLINAALWDSPAELTLADASASTWGFSVREGFRNGPAVRGITVPQVLAECGYNKVDILKCDVEGAERRIFSESCADWLPRIGAVFVELHDRIHPGCSRAFYKQVVRRPFSQTVRADGVFVLFQDENECPPT